MIEHHIPKVLQLWKVQASVYHDSGVSLSAGLKDATLRFREQNTERFYHGDHSACVTCSLVRRMGVGTFQNISLTVPKKTAKLVSEPQRYYAQETRRIAP